MKGVVFTEFIDMVEDVYSPEMVDTLFDSVTLRSGGAYTSVGTYDHKELVALVSELSKQTGTEIPELLRTFGKHLYKSFETKYPQFFDGVPDTLTLLERVDGHIHVEVRKLYPDAELPKFTTRRLPNGDFEMHYDSTRHFEELAYGLIDASIQRFSEAISIEMTSTPEGAVFTLKRT
ncbi:MAG: heme NO-binding domain-containing protein [Planctomycetota bacterium]|nr:heme NO-binding domain-containing protein [Planctomycetota bacterium]